MPPVAVSVSENSTKASSKRSHVCQECGLSFAYKRNLSSHLSVAHSNSSNVDSCHDDGDGLDSLLTTYDITDFTDSSNDGFNAATISSIQLAPTQCDGDSSGTIGFDYSIVNSGSCIDPSLADSPRKSQNEKANVSAETTVNVLIIKFLQKEFARQTDADIKVMLSKVLGALKNSESSIFKLIDRANNNVESNESDESNIFPVRCDICNRGFRTKMHYGRHMKSTHADEVYKSRLNPDDLPILADVLRCEAENRNADTSNRIVTRSGSGNTQTVSPGSGSSSVLNLTSANDVFSIDGDSVRGSEGIDRRPSSVISSRFSSDTSSEHSFRPINHQQPLPTEDVNGETGVNRWKCSHCGDGSFSSRAHLRHHERTNTECNPRAFKCSQCHLMFDQQCLLKLHERTHSEQKDFTCQICGKGFIKKVHFQEHMFSHNPDAQLPFKCVICEKGFARKDTLIRHISSHMRAEDKPSKTKDVKDRRFKCEFCSASFLTSNYLKAHHRRRHRNDTSTEGC